MTWYAHHLFLHPSSSVAAAALALPGAQKHLFHVPPIYSEPEEVQDGISIGDSGAEPMMRTLPGKLLVPPQGMLVLRELCNPGSHAAEWFGEEDALPWAALASEKGASSEPLHDLDAVFQGAPGGWASEAPPAAVLDRFAQLARDTASTAVYFCAHFWGGDMYHSFAWIWRGGGGPTTFLRASVNKDQDGEETNNFYTDIMGVIVQEGSARRFIANADVLTLVMLELGILLNNGYFELHTRSFDWDRYAVTNAAAVEPS